MGLIYPYLPHFKTGIHCSNLVKFQPKKKKGEEEITEKEGKLTTLDLITMNNF